MCDFASCFIWFIEINQALKQTYLMFQIDDFFEGKLGYDVAKTALILVLAISASLSHEINICRIPSRMFSYAVTLLGRISSGLAYALDRHVLFSYLCACSRSTSVSASELIKGDEILQHIVNESSGNQKSWEPSRTQVSRPDCQLEGIDVVALVNLVLAQINNVWQLMQIGCIDEVLEMLRYARIIFFVSSSDIYLHMLIMVV